MVAVEDDLGFALLKSGRWAEARAAFEATLRHEESPAVLEGLAAALLWQGDIAGSVAHNQRAYAGYSARGESLQAAFCALSLSITYNCYLGNESAAGGWLARAETAARASDPALIQGWIWSFQGYLVMDRDIQLAEETERRSLDHARATGDRDLELIAMSTVGNILARRGRAEAGLPMVDEAMAALSAGEHSRLETLVIVCCNMLMACELGADLKRARQWCQIADQFHERYGCPFLHGECRGIYGSLLLAMGKWREAENHLTAAISQAKDAFPAVYLKATARLAELRLHQGRLEEAEVLLSGLEHETFPALALAEVRLVQCQPSTAVRLLRRVLRNRDPLNVACLRARELLIEAHLLQGETDEAAREMQALTALAPGEGHTEAYARTCLASARVYRQTGDTEAAIASADDAIAGFSSLGMPFEAARARFVLAETARSTSPDLAVYEAEQALEAFRHLGAKTAANEAAALLRELGQGTGPGPRGLGLLTSREQEVLALLQSGLSNPEIADRLVISRKTAAHHVSSLLTKLGVRNRTEAVAFAARQLAEA